MPCDIFVDTMGVGFGYPFIKILFGAKIYSYTHYPIVSNDMLKTCGVSETFDMMKRFGNFGNLEDVWKY